MSRTKVHPLTKLQDAWMEQWPAALAVWSRFTRLRAPLLCLEASVAQQEGLQGSFAMIRLTDQAIVVSLPGVVADGVEDLALEILAHEIGHHVLAPATLTEHGRMLARMRRALPTLEAHAPMVANLYTDLLINDRLQRGSTLRMAEVYRRILGGEMKPGACWRLYMRIYELLWRLEPGSLSGPCDDAVQGDAWLGARLIRSYARDWMDGAGKFAALMLPYLVQDQESAQQFAKLADTLGAGRGGDLPGLTEGDDGDETSVQHPALDPRLNGSEEAADEVQGADTAAPSPTSTTREAKGAGQARQPFEYGELLRAAGIALTDHEAAVRYYREQAMPHLVPFPVRRRPRGSDPLPEGLQAWNLGDPLDELDWMQSILLSPRVVPGLTTVSRVWGVSEGAEPKPEPLDLDIYVDSSGSMANPQIHISYPALAGAIVCLSALRAGAKVQATLWSGKREFTSTPGFTRDEEAVLRVLTGYFGGGTAFPIHKLRDTFAQRPQEARPAHVLIISDDGVNTMFGLDERGQSGWQVCAAALAQAKGGGTMVLNLGERWENYPSPGAYADIRRARDEFGWQVHRVASWEGLVAFARQFSQLRYGGREKR